MPLEDTVSAAGSDRFAACVRAVDRYLDEELESLLRGARKSLIFAAQEALDSEEEDRLVSAAEEVESLAPVAGEAFRTAVFARLRRPDESLPDAPPMNEGGGLTLVDSGKVDDWLRMREIVARHTDEAKALETSLRQRLTEAAGIPSDPDNAPVSVPGMCVLFQSAMRKLSAGPEARAAIYDAFEATVVARLGALVAELHRILDGLDEPRPPAPGPESMASLAADPDPAEAPPDEAPEPALAPLEPVRLLGAIATVERQMREVSPGQGLDALAELEVRLAAALTPPGAPLGESKRRAVGAVAALVHQAFAHPGIDPAARARLWKLAPPLALLALQDDDQLDLLLHATRYDPVTGLLDRSAFRVRLEAALTDAAQGKQGFAVCLLEVDAFKDISSRLEPQVAGRLLRVLADLMRGRAGASARLARLRGAEFGVLLPAGQGDTGWRFANRYLAAVNKAHFAVAGQKVASTVSIGVVESDPSLTTVEQVMRAADAALTSAKDDGGGCARVYIPEGFG